MNRTSPVELPEEYLDFYKNLETWQTQQQIKLQKFFSPSHISNPKALIAEQKKPLLIIERFVIDSEQYRTVFSALLDFMLDNRPDLKDTLEDIEAKTHNLDFASYIKDFLNDNLTPLAGLAEEYKISEELLVFLFDHSIRPFLRLYALPYQEELREETFQHWDFPNLCPVCGSKSHFSRIRPADNHRFMFCDRCFTEWETRYLLCVHCGNDTPGTIFYRSVENDEAYRIYTCEKCKGYLKTYDERSGGGSTDLFIANIETIYLDMLAEEQGYTNHDL
ncbi:MAG: formate dehydrogenase accessory protein FdhE [Syntrophomonadaceae bacterium]|nr:formate dehydrogenase accessory protein FdhE [Syntrophomonadaceae bacterium]